MASRSTSKRYHQIGNALWKEECMSTMILYSSQLRRTTRSWKLRLDWFKLVPIIPEPLTSTQLGASQLSFTTRVACRIFMLIRTLHSRTKIAVTPRKLRYGDNLNPTVFQKHMTPLLNESLKPAENYICTLLSTSDSYCNVFPKCITFIQHLWYFSTVRMSPFSLTMYDVRINTTKSDFYTSFVFCCLYNVNI